MILNKMLEKFIYGFSFGTGMGLSFKLLPKENIKKLEKIEEEKYTALLT